MSRSTLLFIFIILLVLSLIPSTFAAVIQGDIYDPELRPLKDVIVTINTQPEQQKVAKNSTYSFFVVPGNYSIEAKFYEQGWVKYVIEQQVTVNNEGTFIVDLILWPTLSEEEQLYNESQASYAFDYDEALNGENTFPYVPFIMGFALLIMVVAAYRSYHTKKQNKKQTLQKVTVSEETTHVSPPEIKVSEEGKESKEEFGDEYYATIMSLIKKHKRLTQKDIRKEVPLSEAKVSLILTEMEEKGIIKKVKKGRGNVILLK